MFTKYGQTEKNFTLPKACKKIGEMNQDIEKIREGLNQEINATLTLEKHNALLLRQVDQLRHLFEHFSEEIMGNLDKSNRNMDEKFFELAKISEEKDLKFEKFAEFLKGHYEEIIGKVQKLQTNDIASLQTQIEVLTKENFKTKNELKEAVFQMNLWKTEIGKIGKVADFGGKTGLESKFMDLEKVINEQKASLNEALASLQGFANGQKKFEGQISEDFAILTSWAKSLERKISLQPVEITCHIEKFIKGFEEDLHKYRKDINGQINEIYKEFSLEVTKLKQDTIQIYSHLKNAKENYG